MPPAKNTPYCFFRNKQRASQYFETAVSRTCKMTQVIVQIYLAFLFLMVGRSSSVRLARHQLGNKVLTATCVKFTENGDVEIPRYDAGQVRSGCCVFSVFYPRQLGCCRKRLYDKKTHTCCDNWQLLDKVTNRSCSEYYRFWSPNEIYGGYQTKEDISRWLRFRESSIHCQFKENCYWKSKGSNIKENWKQRKTTSFGGQYYFHTTLQSMNKIGTSYLISPVLHFYEAHCLTFQHKAWKKVFYSPVTLRVIVNQFSGPTQKLKTRIEPSPFWRRASIQLDRGKQGIVIVAESARNTADVSLAEIQITRGSCDVSFNCSFVDGFCGWYATNEVGNDWRQSPLEKGFVAAYGSTATPTKKLISSPEVRQQTGCLKFTLRLFGSARLTQNFVDDQTSAVVLWSSKQNLKSHWLEYKANILPSSSLQNKTQKYYRFAFFANLSKGEHISIRDVTMSQRPCNFLEFNCDFNTGSLCGWSVKLTPTDKGRWNLMRGRTPTYATGPQGDHSHSSETPSNGFYIYFESSFPRAANDRSSIVSPVIEITEPWVCFTLWYHMNGKDVGSLNVYQQSVQDKGSNNRLQLKKLERHLSSLHSGTLDSLIFVVKGNQGPKWKKASVSIKTVGKFRVKIEAESDGYQGDIAIDDVSFAYNKCQYSDHMQEESDTTAKDENKLNCNFDSNSICNWIQDTRDDFDWQLNSGRSRKKGFTYLSTGPDHDHTTNSSYYIYIPSSELSENDEARLISPEINLSHRNAKCFTFWYHIKGYNTGNVTVKAKQTQENNSLLWTTNLEDKLLWTRSMTDYNESSDWEMAYVDLNPDFHLFVIVIVGNTKSYFGDLAIDDIKLYNTSCEKLQGVGRPYSFTKSPYDIPQPINSKPTLRFTPTPQSDVINVAGRLHKANKVEEGRETMKRNVGLFLLLDASTQSCNQTGINGIYPPNVQSVRKAKRFSSELVLDWSQGQRLSDYVKASLVTFAGWQQMQFQEQERLNINKVMTRIASINPMCEGGAAFRRLLRATRFIECRLAGMDDSVVVLIKSVTDGDENVSWTTLVSEYGEAHTVLSAGGTRDVVAVGIGTFQEASGFYKSELSIVACGHFIYPYCDAIFFTDDVESSSQLVSFLDRRRKSKTPSLMANLA